MGLFPGLTSNTTDEEIKKQQARIGHEIVRIVVRLSEHVRAVALQGLGARISLREMDNVLMEWSRQGPVRSL